jgi:broad specificity phosphatase PhoE
MHALLLLRHGETEWSRSHKHTGRADIPLTARGEDQARALGAAIAGRQFVSVWSSPLSRARRTAELAGLAPRTEPDLQEWDYGTYEGKLTADLERERPGWNLWIDGAAGGEAPAEVGARADRVLARIAADLEQGDVAVVAHGHLLRVLTARYLGLPAGAGAHFQLGTGTLCELGREHGRPVVSLWNAPASAVIPALARAGS